jgi:hypothetical protein
LNDKQDSITSTVATRSYIRLHQTVFCQSSSLHLVWSSSAQPELQQYTVMVLAKFVVFLSLLYVISGASVSMQQAYLAMDTQIPASCHDMPNNQICPSFSHQIVGENANPQALTLRALHSVKLQVGVAIFFQDNQACINNVSEYACSNSLMKCTKSNATVYGFMLNYDVQRTRQACANVQKSCSPHVQDATVHNCSVIQTDPFEFAICNKHTDFPGDVCPRTDYMVKYNKIIVQHCFFVNLLVPVFHFTICLLLNYYYSFFIPNHTSHNLVIPN